MAAVAFGFRPRDRFGPLIGRSPAMRQLFDVLARAAPSESTMIIQGESGTGKELVAQAVHSASRRASGPFVIVDCSSMTATLAESDLFGHERGAFTGAVTSRAGAFEQANGGTLFLDEIGDLPPDLQPKLLRALETRQVRRLGETSFREVDVRILASSSKDIESLVHAGSFRSDLFYRLAVVVVSLPALRQRASDIPLLAEELARRISPDAPSLDDDVLAALAAHPWPGNVRELKNALERLLVMGEPPPDSSSRPVFDYRDARRRALGEFEREYCREVLADANGVVSRAAERAGLSRQMFHRLMKRHGLSGEGGA